MLLCREAQAWRRICSGGYRGSWCRWPAQSQFLPHLLHVSVISWGMVSAGWGRGRSLGIPGGPPLEESSRYGALENRVMGQGIRAGSVPTVHPSHQRRTPVVAMKVLRRGACPASWPWSALPACPSLKFSYLLAAPRSTWDLSSPTRNRACSGSAESQPLATGLRGEVPAPSSLKWGWGGGWNGGNGCPVSSEPAGLLRGPGFPSQTEDLQEGSP